MLRIRNESFTKISECGQIKPLRRLSESPKNLKNTLNCFLGFCDALIGSYNCVTNFGPPGICDKCLRGWTGENCNECATNFGPIGQCDQCLRGSTGKNCSECAINLGPSGECDQCLRGWTGQNCSECATNFEPSGLCNRCALGWTGNNCDVCGFGYNTESNCTECIQNGTWMGKWIDDSLVAAYLTFEGPGCSKVTPGLFIWN